MSSPWQLRGTDTRPKEFLGVFEPFGRASKQAPEIIRVFGNAVGDTSFHARPHELVGIKLRSVSGEKVRMNTGMVFKEPLDRPGLVHTASVPQKHKSSVQVPEKVSQERQDLRMPDVLQGMKADIQSNPPFARRDADDRDGRYLRPSPGDFKNRSLSNGSPGLSDSRDKAKPSLVEEDKGDVKPFGLFLYAAMNGVSTVLFPSHPARGLLSVVFDNSNPFRSGATRYYWNDKIP